MACSRASLLWSRPACHRIGKRLAKVDPEFLARQIALLIEGQREIKAELASIRSELGEVKGQLAELATRDLLVRVLRSFEGQVDAVEIRTQLLQESLASRVKAAESRLEALEAKP